MLNAQDDLQQRWWNLEVRMVERFGKKPDMETILFLIGVQEMHIAICSLLSRSGYYEMERVDADGWPHYKQLKEMPKMGLIEQENFLKDHILLYFEEDGF